MGAPVCWLPPPPVPLMPPQQEETAAQESHHEPSRPVLAESLSRPRSWTSGVHSVPARPRTRVTTPFWSGRPPSHCLVALQSGSPALQHTWHRVWMATAMVFRTQMLKHMKGQSSLLIFTVCSEHFPNSKALRQPPPPPPPHTTPRGPATHTKPRLRVLGAWLPSRIWEDQTGTGISVTVGGESQNQVNEVTRHTAHRHAHYTRIYT